MVVEEEGEEVVEEERSSDTLTYRSFPRHTRTRMCVCIMCVRVCVCVLENSNIFDHYLGTIPTVIPAPPVTSTTNSAQSSRGTTAWQTRICSQETV